MRKRNNNRYTKTIFLAVFTIKVSETTSFFSSAAMVSNIF
jgi:hypothetical protein